MTRVTREAMAGGFAKRSGPLRSFPLGSWEKRRTCPWQPEFSRYDTGRSQVHLSGLCHDAKALQSAARSNPPQAQAMLALGAGATHRGHAAPSMGEVQASSSPAKKCRQRQPTWRLQSPHASLMSAGSTCGRRITWCSTGPALQQPETVCRTTICLQQTGTAK